jgi:hypothetical protein
MLYHSDKLSQLHKSCVAVTFAALYVLNVVLLVIVIGNLGLWDSSHGKNYYGRL